MSTTVGQSVLELEPGNASLEQLELILFDPFAQGADVQPIAITLHEKSRKAIDAASAAVGAVVEKGKPVYGINTGFGKLASVQIAAHDTSTLQRNLVLSHCAGVGDITEVSVTRLMMALKLLSLGRGASGVRWCIVELIQALLAKGITPIVPSQGSVGASGDLAPLAHFAAVLMGEGEALYENRRMSSEDALKQAGLQPIEFAAKEGLALINGTQFSCAYALMALFRTWRSANAVIVTSALSTDAIMGSTAPLRPEIQQLRGHQGQIDVAKAMSRLMQGSEIRESHREGDTRVQDPYCIRCQPQVAGACVDLLRQCANTLLIEANAVTDNPLIVISETDPNDISILSCGNFHAEPVAFAADQIALAIAELGSIAQRRIALMVDPSLSFDLPPFLTPEPGLCSGFMVAEITTAALMSENKHLANPCSTDSTPTSANQEDHVSMAAHGARRLVRMNDNLSLILGVELLCAARGIEFRLPLTTSVALQSVIAQLRKSVPTLTTDRYMSTDIERASQLINSGEIINLNNDCKLPCLSVAA